LNQESRKNGDEKLLRRDSEVRTQETAGNGESAWAEWVKGGAERKSRVKLQSTKVFPTFQSSKISTQVDLNFLLMSSQNPDADQCAERPFSRETQKLKHFEIEASHQA
jgi:hypothetical protein